MVDLKDLLPGYLKNNPVWRDYADVIQKEIRDKFNLELSVLRDIRDATKIPEDFHEKSRMLLGLFTSSAEFSTPDQKSRLIESLPGYWERSGTIGFLDFLAFTTDISFTYKELYCYSDIVRESTNSELNYFASNIPIIPKSIEVKNSQGDLLGTDDGLGNLLNSSEDHIGQVNYETGKFEFLISNVDNLDYHTYAYHLFFTDLEKDNFISSFPEAANYNWYLTNHVALEYDSSGLIEGELGIEKIFYAIAPAVLVLRSTSPALFGNSTLSPSAYGYNLIDIDSRHTIYKIPITPAPSYLVSNAASLNNIGTKIINSNSSNGRPSAHIDVDENYSRSSNVDLISDNSLLEVEADSTYSLSSDVDLISDNSVISLDVSRTISYQTNVNLFSQDSIIEFSTSVIKNLSTDVNLVSEKSQLNIN